MSRDIATVLNNVLGDEVLEVFFAVDLEFDSGTLRMWTGYGDKTINGEVYTGTGTLLQVSEVEETAELAAAGATLTLNGLPSEILTLALIEPYQNRRARIYFGITGAVDDMAEVFTATMDAMDIEENADTVSIRLTLENRLLDLERARIRRYTNNDQQSRYPGDLGLEFVDDLQNREIFWGRAS